MTKKNNKKVIILIIVLLISIGYTALNTTLNINGITNIKENTWDIHFENVQVKDGSVQANTPQIDQDRTTVTYSVTLDKPGDYFEFTVDAVNDGTIDGMIESIVKTNLTPSQSKYLNNSITYLSGLPVEENDLLKTGESVVFKIRVEYKKDIRADDLPDDNINGLNLSLTVNYIQKDTNAVEKPRQITYRIHTTGYNPLTFQNNQIIADIEKVIIPVNCMVANSNCTIDPPTPYDQEYYEIYVPDTLKDYDEGQLEILFFCPPPVDGNYTCYQPKMKSELTNNNYAYDYSTEKNLHYNRNDPEMTEKVFNFDKLVFNRTCLNPQCEVSSYEFRDDFFINLYSQSNNGIVDLYPLVFNR